MLIKIINYLLIIITYKLQIKIQKIYLIKNKQIILKISIIKICNKLIINLKLSKNKNILNNEHLNLKLIWLVKKLIN